MSLDSKDRIALNDLARRSFRDVADQDYLAARACYRSGLMLQFVWMAQQAVEKYLKAILLFNQLSTKNLGHNIAKALNSVDRIDPIEFELPQDTREFIGWLNRHGANRYLERDHYTRGCELPSLDKCVWHLRLFCQPINWSHPRAGDMRSSELAAIKHWMESTRPSRFRLNGGFLEILLSKLDDPRRCILVWQNAFFGHRCRKSIRIPSHSNSVKPPQVLYPERMGLYLRFVKFPISVEREWKNFERNA